MPLITWDESFSVNVRELDEEHKRFAAMLNDLNQAMKDGHEKDALESTLVDLIGYAATHFRAEERYFDLFGYPDTENHKKEHADFLKSTAAFIDKFEKGETALTDEVMYFLGKWLVGHILGVDKHYSEFFNEHGLK